MGLGIGLEGRLAYVAHDFPLASAEQCGGQLFLAARVAGIAEEVAARVILRSPDLVGGMISPWRLVRSSSFYLPEVAQVPAVLVRGQF